MDSVRTSVAIHVGRFDYDLSTLGKSNLVGLRIDRPMARSVIAEANLQLARPRDENGDAHSLFIPELQVQAQAPVGFLAPYIGVGGGVAWDPSAERSATPSNRERLTDPTFSASAGVRAQFSPLFGGRAELRMRGIGGQFTGKAKEITVGFAARL